LHPRLRFDIATAVHLPSRSRFAYERILLERGFEVLAGVDEAGRGPLAGPVVAAAVILPPEWIRDGLPFKLRGLNDSKLLTPDERDEFYGRLVSAPELRFGIGIVDSVEIDRLNILRASHAAMVSALGELAPPPQHVLVDGLWVSAISLPQTAIIHGDARSYSIAAASVLAKVTRDRMMLDFHQRWPDYGFAEHKGYSTPQHEAALKQHGPCPIHRRSFAPVTNIQLDLFPE
jgi:ribonuclease HII